jgi:hypothetical protein
MILELFPFKKRYILGGGGGGGSGNWKTKQIILLHQCICMKVVNLLCVNL